MTGICYTSVELNNIHLATWRIVARFLLGITCHDIIIKHKSNPPKQNLTFESQIKYFGVKLVNTTKPNHHCCFMHKIKTKSLERTIKK